MAAKCQMAGTDAGANGVIESGKTEMSLKRQTRRKFNKIKSKRNAGWSKGK